MIVPPKQRYADLNLNVGHSANTASPQFGTLAFLAGKRLQRSVKLVQLFPKPVFLKGDEQQEYWETTGWP